MGLGSSEPRREIFYLAMKATRDKKLDPHFAVTKRENNKTIQLNDEYSVSGYLIRINHGKYEFPKNSGEFVETVAIHLLDGGAEFKIETSVNTSLARNLMNKIVGINNWEWVTLRVYTKNEFAQLFVGNNDQPMPWRFDYEKELKPLVEEFPDPQKKDKMIKVYHKINALLLNEWVKCERLVQENAKNNKTIMEALKIGSTKAAETPADDGKPLTGADFPNPTDGAQDDIPFTPPIETDDLPF